MQHKLFLSSLLLALLVACTPRQTRRDSAAAMAEQDMLVLPGQDSLLLQEVEEEEVVEPTRADELFDDFIFNYASDPALQRRRTVFPLPYYNGDTPERIEEDDWEHDYLFAQQSFYTLLFDREEDMDMVGDTTLHSVQIEFFPLGSNRVKKFYFEKKNGMWMLEAINLREIQRGSNAIPAVASTATPTPAAAPSTTSTSTATSTSTDQSGLGHRESFLEFYARFVTDSVYQLAHIRDPLPYITLDPDDEFSILETTIDAGQWSAFSPALPTEGLTNINYGQRNEDLSREKILKVNGIGNGYSNVFYFKRRHGEWELYKFEDTSI